MGNRQNTLRGRVSTYDPLSITTETCSGHGRVYDYRGDHISPAVTPIDRRDDVPDEMMFIIGSNQYIMYTADIMRMSEYFRIMYTRPFRIDPHTEIPDLHMAANADGEIFNRLFVYLIHRARVGQPPIQSVADLLPYILDIEDDLIYTNIFPVMDYLFNVDTGVVSDIVPRIAYRLEPVDMHTREMSVPFGIQTRYTGVCGNENFTYGFTFDINAPAVVTYHIRASRISNFRVYDTLDSLHYRCIPNATHRNIIKCQMVHEHNPSGIHVVDRDDVVNIFADPNRRAHWNDGYEDLFITVDTSTSVISYTIMGTVMMYRFKFEPSDGIRRHLTIQIEICALNGSIKDTVIGEMRANITAVERIKSVTYNTTEVMRGYDTLIELMNRDIADLGAHDRDPDMAHIRITRQDPVV